MAVGMGGAMLLFQVLVPLLLVATASSSGEKVFRLSAGSIVLQAEPVTEEVTSIIWKHNKDKAAEWFKGDDAPTYYSIFKDVTTLDMKTWALTISKLQQHFSGIYSAEVNNKDPSKFLTLNVLEQVPKPTITMECIDITCNLTCEGKTDGSTEYTWANDIGGKWSGSKLTVKMTDDDVVYTCSISNQASSASSNGTVKKYVPPTTDPGPGEIIGGIIGGLIAGLSLYACICLLVFKKKEETKSPEDEEKQEMKMTEHKEAPGDEEKQEMTNTGNIWNVLKSMTCRDRCRIFIPCIKVPSGKDKVPEAVPLRSVNGDDKQAGAKQDPSPEDDKKPAKTGPDPSDEGKENETSIITEGERNDPDGAKDSPEMSNAGDKKPPGVNPDSPPEGEQTEMPGVPTADGDDKKLAKTGPDTSDEGKENEMSIITEGERNDPDGAKDSPEMSNAGDKKPPGVNPDSPPEGEQTEMPGVPTADGEPNSQDERL